MGKNGAKGKKRPTRNIHKKPRTQMWAGRRVK